MADKKQKQIRFGNGIIRDVISCKDFTFKMSCNILYIHKKSTAFPGPIKTTDRLKRATCRPLIWNFTQIGQSMWKVWTQLHLCFHCAKFHGTQQALNKLGATSVQNFIHKGGKMHKI
jgi:hypothetical protein